MLALAESKVIRGLVAQRQWFVRRTTGAHRVTTKVQSALNRFQQYLKGYSGVVEIVKQADPKFGKLAYATMSIFLVVIENKTKEEEILAKTLDSLGRDIDHVTRISDCIPSKEAGSLIIPYYVAVIEFATEATRYFSISGPRRVWTVIRKSPTNFLEDKISDIQDCMKIIKNEAKTVLYESNSRLLALYKEERDYRNVVQIRPLRKRLRLQGSCLNNMQEYWETFFLKDFWPNKYETFDFNRMISGDPVYKNWRDQESSQMLLVHGSSHMGGYNWLSAAALTLIATLTNEAKGPADELWPADEPLFAFLHPQPWLPDSALVPHAHVISSLIEQYLGHHPEVAEDFAFLESLEEQVESQEWLTDATCELQYGVLKQLLQRRKKSYIILDRLDSCECPISMTLQYFLKLIGECEGAIVKIFVVAPLDKSGLEDVISPYKKSKLRVIQRDQGKRKRW